MKRNFTVRSGALDGVEACWLDDSAKAARRRELEAAAVELRPDAAVRAASLCDPDAFAILVDIDRARRTPCATGG